MNFYSALSRHYDEIFPAEAEEMSFLFRQFEGKTRILDIACGTGNKTILFNAPGRRILGIDDAPGMIAATKKHEADGLSYRELNMRSIGQTFKKGSFDGILCLGNSLVHLTDPEAIGRLIKDMATLLEDGGLAAIQILNYDRILYLQITDLPALETDKLTFTRRYQHEKGLLRFQTSLSVKDDEGKEEKEENDIPLYPLRKEEMGRMFLRAGFKEVSYYGSYQGGRLSGESFVLIALARK